jgi:membrane protein
VNPAAAKQRPREVASAIADGFREHHVLTFANAIAFRIAFAVVPLTLSALGLLGSLHAQTYYEHHVAPEIASHVSESVYVVVDQTAVHVLTGKQLWWATIGLAIALWQVSAAVRAVMAVLDALYEPEHPRPWQRRYPVSFALGALAMVVLLATVALVQIGPDGLLTPVRWIVALALLAGLIATMTRFAPSDTPSWRLVSRGSGVTLVCWVVTSLAFGFYVRELASFGSVFGNLATVMIGFEYLYLSSIAFLTGLVLDHLAETEI